VHLSRAVSGATPIVIQPVDIEIGEHRPAYLLLEFWRATSADPNREVVAASRP
jgi:hypothetical protein